MIHINFIIQTSMKKLILLALTAIIAVSSFAQTSNEVALVTNGQGSTKREATENALRSAIEQAFGVFVSANTEILNDELVKDEIATVSSGNIQSYEEISSDLLPDNTYEVTLNVVVSINKLVTYAQSHGSSCELAGQTFLMQQRMIELRRDNTAKAIIHFLDYIEQFIHNTNIWDCKLEVGTPKVVRNQNDIFQIPVKTKFQINQSVASHITCKAFNFLHSITLSKEEVIFFERQGVTIANVVLYIDNNGTNRKALGNIYDELLRDYSDRRNPRDRDRFINEFSYKAFVVNFTKKDYDELEKRIENIRQILAKQLYVLYDNNGNIYYKSYYDEWEGFEGFKYDYESCISSVSYGSRSYECETGRLKDPRILLCLQDGCTYGHFSLFIMRFLSTFEFQGKWDNIFPSREQLTAMTDLKLEMYNFSPIKTVYGDSYIKASEKEDPSLLKKQQ